MHFNTERLFVQLSYRLGRARTVAVLMYLLDREADQREIRTTLTTLSTHGLAGKFTLNEVRKAINDLVTLGLVSTLVHPNTRTHLKVDRAAVLDLLAAPLPDELPGVRQSSCSFLDAWRNHASSGCTAAAQPRAQLPPTTESEIP